MENESEKTQLPEWYLEERTKLDKAILDAIKSEKVNFNLASKKGFSNGDQRIMFSFNVAVQDASITEERNRIWKRFL